MKKCTKCNEEKPLDQFNSRSWKCKPCQYEYTRAHYRANKEKYKDFLERLNDLEEFSSRKDYLNPSKYMHLRMSLDQDFMAHAPQ